MNCRQIDNFILDYCENKLPDDMMQEIQEHISHCPFCGNNEKWTRLENKVLQKTAEIPPLSDNFCAVVMQQLQARDQMSAIAEINAGKRKTLYTAFSALAMAAVILLVIIIPTGLQNDKVPLQLAQNTNSEYGKTSMPKQMLAESKPDEAAKHNVDDTIKHDADEAVGASNISNKQKAASPSISVEIEPLPPYEDYNRGIKDGSRALLDHEKMFSLPTSSDAMIPAGIPPQYHLVKNVSENNRNTFYYSRDGETSDSNISFVLSVCESGTEMKTLNNEAATVTPMSIASIPEKNNRTIEYEGKVYIIELEVLSNDQDLAPLLNSIVLAPASQTSENTE